LPSIISSTHFRFLLMSGRQTSNLTFGPNSQVSLLRVNTFSGCSSLRSGCIPSSVHRLLKCCFLGCSSLSSVISEPGRRLSTLGGQAFRGCESLRSICIASPVETVSEFCFRAYVRVRSVIFEPGSGLLVLGRFAPLDRFACRDQFKAFPICASVRAAMFRI
jgi:hypothetical protein